MDGIKVQRLWIVRWILHPGSKYLPFVLPFVNSSDLTQAGRDMIKAMLDIVKGTRRLDQCVQESDHENPGSSGFGVSVLGEDSCLADHFMCFVDFEEGDQLRQNLAYRCTQDIVKHLKEDRLGTLSFWREQKHRYKFLFKMAFLVSSMSYFSCSSEFHFIKVNNLVPAYRSKPNDGILDIRLLRSTLGDYNNSQGIPFAGSNVMYSVLYDLFGVVNAAVRKRAYLIFGTSQWLATPHVLNSLATSYSRVSIVSPRSAPTSSTSHWWCVLQRNQLSLEQRNQQQLSVCWEEAQLRYDLCTTPVKP